MSGKVLTALEWLEGAVIEIELQPEAATAAQLPAARSGPTAIKVETEKLDGPPDILGELVITFALSSRHAAISQEQNRDLQENVQALDGPLERLEKQVAVIRMPQLSNLFMRISAWCATWRARWARRPSW
ncbi:MAG: hypothetical protein V1797_02795 [Pseudomonadota bacterium]